ncbi:aminotransferase class I/II-fold pyridoxal phosphate-dependent enzyme [Agrobacterium vitis]|uniref:Aminotransferase class I/II-fold pyridoxal phosphate-dependent enzyme n=1 Tax=Agrobacterium vitis TaxID=373 RepID=A0ABD6GIE8_AGRVI|nr:PLP-dependent aminotransferase family protein [Agrobacterium vitis]MUO80947.1 aminotransferase class I/II-fold pyridoxal phosphate-dependent enzyme [Agrobacterium vitis]MUO97442.1 aminotransferase class I/II-fold pyridoxal phosphate-dependent enzyme [Agrobacterium vitis]MUP06526.1 aminotransferase class I/II-fold pyridoxal phosphate-dependent enzyme [Agrobacterium vitis]MUZ84130.1 aminotransferase class I/II-fold pyridoxal phosphate-dependent enzyme [Agrobacterium vitis]MVA10811.1 aminotran
MVTHWLPDLSTAEGPLYIRIADRAEADIKTGRLSSGAKLPPQRDLAFDLKVTIGTITRAYALLRERGLVTGEVGRGTYVQSSLAESETDIHRDPVTLTYGGTRTLSPPPGKLRFDTTAAIDVGQADIIGRLMTDIARDQPDEIASYTRTLLPDWLEAGRRWLSNGDWSPEAANIVPQMGVHAGVNAVIAAISGTGDRIVCEHLTYSQIARSASLMGRQISLVDSDHDGIMPEDFERVCAREHPKAAFIMSSGQNPTLSCLPLSRRLEIVDIARRYNVWLIEDYIYGALVGDGIPLLAQLAPDRTFLLNSLSKSVAAGVRGGWVACPDHMSQRVRVTQKMVCGGLPFLLAELSARLVLSGAADDIRGRVLEELSAREQIVRQLFEGYEFRSHPHLPYFWLKLPEPWLSGTFKQAALDQGVLIDDEDEFKPARSSRVFHHIRAGFSEGRDRSIAEGGLITLRRILDQIPVGSNAVM